MAVPTGSGTEAIHSILLEDVANTAKPRGKRPHGKRTSLGSDFEFPKRNLR